jgi:hypothetical protein
MEHYCLKQEHFADDKRVANLINKSERRTAEVCINDIVREMIEYRMLPDDRALGVQAFPDLDVHSMRPVSRSVLGSKFVATIRVADVYSEDPERPYREDKVDCPAGLWWALAFHAGACVVGAACWSLHMLLR